jgi:hypothetical protein
MASAPALVAEASKSRVATIRIRSMRHDLRPTLEVFAVYAAETTSSTLILR